MTPNSRSSKPLGDTPHKPRSNRRPPCLQGARSDPRNHNINADFHAFLMLVTTAPTVQGALSVVELHPKATIGARCGGGVEYHFLMLLRPNGRLKTRTKHGVRCVLGACCEPTGFRHPISAHNMPPKEKVRADASSTAVTHTCDWTCLPLAVGRLLAPLLLDEHLLSGHLQKKKKAKKAPAYLTGAEHLAPWGLQVRLMCHECRRSRLFSGQCEHVRIDARDSCLV